VPDVVARAARETVSILDVAVATIVVRQADNERIVMHWPDDAAVEADRSLEVAESAGTYGRVVRRAIEGADVLAVPVPIGGRNSWAAIAVQGRAGSLTTDEESVLRLVAQLTGAAIEHAQLFEAAAASERRTRAIVEASPVAILEIAADDVVVASNAAAVTLLHWDEGGLRALPLDLVREVDVIRDRLDEGADVVDHRATVRRPNESPVDLTIAAALVDETGDNLLCMLSDITERNALEREVQVKGRMEALGRLAGGVAHDFNNLLTIIVGHADLVAHQLPVGHELVPDVEAIRAASQRASAFTEQLLSISRRRVGNEMVVNLTAAIADLETVLRRLIPSNISFVTQLDPIVGNVRVDRSQLDRVVLNLVSNARDSMWGAGGILTVATRRSADGHDAVLTVTDTGVGMDAATLERCFEPFFTTRRASSGTGLGLATVYGIVVQAGGQITVESAPGTGAEFRVAFPITDDELTPVPSSGPPGLPHQATGVVLLVEDEDEVKAVMSQVLARAGYEVHVASSGHRALALAADLPTIDILVTDVVMPGISGPDLAANLTVRRPGLPVLFVSGYVDSAQRERVLRLQPHSRFLAKPFGIEELAEAVRETMRLGRPAEPRRAASPA
jgi:signal transduction histidine kinase/CheY-like chemotaxis protein